MSFQGEYETSKVGPTTVIAFNATGGAVKVVRLRAATSTKRTSFAIRALTGDLRIRQGATGVTISATDPGLMISTTLRWRVDVESETEALLAFVGDTATVGSIEITKISDCAEYAAGDTPAVV